ncbi:MAG: hypothetical protein PHN42_02400 [Bacilli bacterium]|nr:hypothetical protein [Bacilli bacterium]
MKKRSLYLGLLFVLIIFSCIIYFALAEKEDKIESINDTENIISKVESIFKMSISNENNYFDESNFALSDLTANQKINAVISYLNLTAYTQDTNNYRNLTEMEKNKIIKEYKNLFNQEFNFSEVNDIIGLCPFIYKENNNYVITNECGGIFFDDWYFVNTKMTKSSDEIKLYSKIGFKVVTQENGTIKNFYLKDGNNEEAKTILSLSLKEYEEKNNSNYFKEYIQNNLSKFHTYIFTFRQNDNGEYYFSKMERK